MDDKENRRPPGRGSGDKIIAGSESIYPDSNPVTHGHETRNVPQDVYEWPDYSKIIGAYARALWWAGMAALEEQMEEIETIFWGANLVEIFDPASEPKVCACVKIYRHCECDGTVSRWEP